MDLQQYLIDSDQKRRRRGRLSGTAGSIIFHGLLIAVFVFAGAQSAKHSVASEKAISAFITQGAAPPPPPPPPPPPKSSGGAKATPQVQQQPKPVKITPQTLIAPREIPKEIPDVKPMTSAMVEEVALPEVSSIAPTDAGTAGGDADAGVPGGVEGGVAGGTVGGVVGGELGGEIGGQLGGVVGGKIGGTGTGTEGSGTGGPEAPVAPEPPPPPPPPPAPAGPLRVGGEVKAPVAINRPEPVYTSSARNGRIEGTVIVEAIISKSGTVQDVRVLKGLPMGLSEAAEDAVKKWRFKPGTLNGQPVATIFNLTVTFKLD